jgi:peptide/nickel transport system permease protein
MPNNRGVLKFIARRLALGVLSLFVVSLVVFAATQLLPSDPAQAILGRNATVASTNALRAKLGLDHTAFYQYTHWLKGIVTGDPGDSFAASVPILSYISDRVVNSLFLLVLASLVSIPLSLWFGGYSARKRDKTFDNITSNTMLALASLPEFVVGIILVLVFSLRVFHVLPAVSAIGLNKGPWTDMKGAILPTATLVIGAVPYISRVVRASMIEVLESDYIEMARLKGAPERVVLWRHALPNALGPVFQVIALNIAYFAAGVIVVEALFNYPGVGVTLRDAVQVRDIPVIQFLVMVLAAVYVVTNIAADVATVLVTPRLRTRMQ